MNELKEDQMHNETEFANKLEIEVNYNLKPSEIISSFLGGWITAEKKYSSSTNEESIMDYLERNDKIVYTIESIDNIAIETGFKTGKWLVFRKTEEIDEAWNTVIKYLSYGFLGDYAKVSKNDGSGTHVICIYTKDYLDENDRKRVRDYLRNAGFIEELCYKPDIYTILGIYKNHPFINPCRFKE